MSVTYKEMLGRKPWATESGDYAYGGETNLDGEFAGWEGGFGGGTTGLLGDEDGFNAKADGYSGQGFYGYNSDGKVGVSAKAQVQHAQAAYGTSGKGKFAGVSGDALGIAADHWYNPDEGYSAGAQAYLAQGDITAGNIGSGKGDEEWRFGASAGVGAAGRLHWGDKDKDGYKEYGFGADLGPVAFDIKTEDPLLTLAKLNPAFAPLAWGADYLGGDKFNLTESVSDTMGDIGDGIGSAADYVGEGIGNAADYVGGGISDAADFVGSFLPSLW